MSISNLLRIGIGVFLSIEIGIDISKKFGIGTSLLLTMIIKQTFPKILLLIINVPFPLSCKNYGKNGKILANFLGNFCLRVLTSMAQFRLNLHQHFGTRKVSFFIVKFTANSAWNKLSLYS